MSIEVKYQDSREPEAFVEGKYFRVHTISKVVSVDSNTHALHMEVRPINEGLAIEKRDADYEGKNNYYVVAFIEPHEYKKNPLDTETVCFADMNPAVDLIDVNLRTVDMIKENMSMEDFWEMMQEYKNCVNFAISAVIEALKGE